MWLTLDVGNSAVKGGVFTGDHLARTFRSSRDSLTLAEVLSAEIRDRSVRRVGVTSVVPETTDAIRRILAEARLEVELITPSMKLPFELHYKTPRTLGGDRLAAAAAAYVLYRPAADEPPSDVVVLDAGTALTCEVITKEGAYLGGAIAPGPALVQRALSRDTAQLPEVPLTLPGRPIGQSTVESMQVGIMYGFIDTVRGLLARLETQLKGSPLVVVTGGWAALLTEHLPADTVVEPHLVLKGIRLLMELNS